MTRVRFDPSFFDDERWERLGSDAVALHISALSYVVRTLSDGLISHKRLVTLAPMVEDVAQVRDVLLKEGLWMDVGDGTVRVCDVREDLRHADGRGDEQPARVYVEKERTRAREAKEKWRAKRNAVPTRVPNGAHASADQSMTVQDPSGPGPNCHHDRRPGECTACLAPRCEHDLPLASDGSGCARCVKKVDDLRERVPA